MNQTLGLDLGSNSLGWAVLDNSTGEIRRKGVLIFPEGIDPANDTLETPAAIRRAARMGRRLKFRRKMRKWFLLKLLIENRMSPLKSEELEAWKKNGAYPIGNTAFIKWLHASDTSNPYIDRANAASGPVDPWTLGRALYHLAQRRGFKSSRKDAASEEDDSNNSAKDLGKVKDDIRALTEEIKAAGCQTLGQYFKLRLDQNRGKAAKTRIRKRYTGRVEHYEKEFEIIMKVQGYKPEDDFYKKARQALFMQRPLRSQKHLVGNCPLEPACPRAQIGHPLFEEFRMLAFVNNLSFEDDDGNFRDANGNPLHPLSSEDRARVCAQFMKVSPTFKFSSISKAFKKDFKANGLHFHYYRDDETVSSCSTRTKLLNGFGDVPFDEQKVFDALSFYDNDDLLKGWFARHYPDLKPEQIAALVKIHPREGNAQYSLKAIRLMLPFLRRGYELSQARFYAKLSDVVPEFSEHEETILDNLKAILFEYRADKAGFTRERARQGETVKPLIDRYHDYLTREARVDELGWKTLLRYLHGDEQYVAETEYRNHGEIVKLSQPRLPPVQLGMIRNPLVQRSMTTLRRLVNYLGEHGIIDPSDTIRIELAREVNDYATRHALQNWQKARAAEREKARRELGANATEDSVDRYILWEEQGHICLYTGKSISLADLMGGTNFDIEHTIPRSLSGDDSLANKTLCDAAYNREVKKGHVPTDCPNIDEINVRLAAWREKLEVLEKSYKNQLNAAKGAVDPAQRSARRIKALTTRLERDYWRDKLRRFSITSDKLAVADGGLSGFKRRQLVDTGIMCSHAVDLLRSVYPQTFAVNGQATSFARRAWGIQGDEAKDRSNHTHHAKDAMVIAALTPARFTAICTALKDDATADYRRACDVCPEPYPHFSETVRRACDEILVKHLLRQTTLRPSSKWNVLAHAHHLQGDPSKPLVRAVLSKGDTVRGQLHLDTFYGCITSPETRKLEKVIRKPLVGPVKTAKELVAKIVDANIREIVEAAIARMETAGVKNIEPGQITMPSGVPINKVRVYAPNARNASTLHPHAMPSAKDYKTPYYVTSSPGSNFRLALFDCDGEICVKPDNSLLWAQGHKKADYVPLDAQSGFVGYIMPGSMALTHTPGHPEEVKTLPPLELKKRLYKIVKFRTDGLMTLRFNSEARASVILAKDLVTEGKHAAGESKIALTHPHELLLISPSVFARQVMFEGIDFKMLIDGTIQFIDRKQP